MKSNYTESTIGHFSSLVYMLDLYAESFSMQYMFLICVSVLFISCSNGNNNNVIKAQEPANEEITQDSVPLSVIYGHFAPEQDSNFVLIDDKYADRSGMYLHKEAYSAFERMWTAANNDGIKLVVRSATRNFNYQKSIWERKWTGATTLSDGTKASDIEDPVQRALKILEYSSMPGTSRHHWGTEVDLNSFENSWFESGIGKQTYDWLVNNADAYGFCQVYSKKDSFRPEGYNEEKWHWSYTPLSSGYTKQARSSASNQDIRGFLGEEAAEPIDVLNNYILGINNNCNH